MTNDNPEPIPHDWPVYRTIIAGSRTIGDETIVEKAVSDCGWGISTVICGCAAGVDTLGKLWAQKTGVPVEDYPAQWDTHGRRAGYLRNVQMAEVAEALILIWDGKSPGSKMMRDIALKKGLRIHEKIV